MNPNESEAEISHICFTAEFEGELLDLRNFTLSEENDFHRWFLTSRLRNVKRC